jgi:hypothetical protein
MAHWHFRNRVIKTVKYLTVNNSKHAVILIKKCIKDSKLGSTDLISPLTARSYTHKALSYTFLVT